MSDLINRQKAVQGVKELFSMGDLYCDELSIVGMLYELPSAEPERKKGEWVYDGIRGRFPACKCSICGHYENADWALLQGVNYCPNCGADMRGEHE